MKTFWKPKYLDLQPCITPNEPAPPNLPVQPPKKSKKGKRRKKIEREIMISVSHLIRKKIKTEDIILENDSESLVMGSKLTGETNRSEKYVRRAKDDSRIPF